MTMDDLISRDAVIKTLNGGSSIRTMLGGVSGIWINLMDAIGEIERVPAAEPVRHGTWEKRTYWIGSFGENQMVCSECGKKYGFHAPYNYCPYCGAKMDGRRAESHT